MLFIYYWALYNDLFSPAIHGQVECLRVLQHEDKEVVDCIDELER